MDDSQVMNATARLPSKSSSAPKFKKAPDAPKRFKSAFIIFSAEKHKEIKSLIRKTMNLIRKNAKVIVEANV